MSLLRPLLLAFAMVSGCLVAGCAESPTSAAPAATPAVPLAKNDAAPIAIFPQRREFEGHTLVIHAPQVRSWPEFERFEAWVAIELTPPGGAAVVYATAVMSGDTHIDMSRRLVELSDRAIDRVIFTGAGTPALEELLRRTVRDEPLDIPLDLFLAYLADDVLSAPPPAGFNMAAPPIVVRSTPAIALFVNGDAVPADIPGTGLKLLVNANWPLFTDGSSYYLLYRDHWLTSRDPKGGWSFAPSLPAGFTNLPAGENFDAIRAALPLQPGQGAVPEVLYVTVPTELIVTDGAPDVVPISGTDGLAYVANTTSPLFKYDGDWYYLTAGRWFRSDQLERGPWTWAAQLPDAFSLIPPEHPMAAALASVPGTGEAKMAALEASLPVKNEVGRDATPDVEVTFAGEPEFEPVEGTGVARAINTGFDILEFEGRYYLLYGGAWYLAGAPIGPWSLTDSVPAEIYSIPPSSPAYNATQVQVASATSSTVTYAYPASYTSSVYVVYGVPYYGTGWYYPPYYYGGYYYPYWGSYGHGSWYNPATGGYGSRSVWYGPYGGYSYSQGYNPNSGRYGWVETAWDGNEWGSYGETYNPRTGVGTETSRYYNEDDNRSKMERTTERGGESITTERKVDYDKGSVQVERETSGGASSSTLRQDGRSVTSIEGSGGGQGVSVSGAGPGRSTVIQSGSGDLYAGHNGSVYKKTDTGWQQYENGNWSPAEAPERPEGMSSERVRPSTGDRGGEPAYSSQTLRANADAAGGSVQPRPSSLPAQDRSGNYSQLNRDHSARQRGQQQYQQRSVGGRSGMRRGGGGRRR